MIAGSHEWAAGDLVEAERPRQASQLVELVRGEIADDRQVPGRGLQVLPERHEIATDRPEVGEGFNPLASLFKQFELIYVVGNERDIVGVRTNHRDETVYLYRLNTSADDARRLLLVYLDRINDLADQPEFYHLLSNSCTINIIRYANAAGREGRFDIRHLLNGLIDSYLYHSGRVDTTLPFDELRQRSLINEAAQAADSAPDFSKRIRTALPTAPR